MSSQTKPKASLAYFRTEAIEEYVRLHHETVLPEFISSRLLGILWGVLLLLLFLLAIVGGWLLFVIS